MAYSSPIRLGEDDIEKSVNCIHHLATLGEFQINITPYINLVFLYQRWLAKEKFLQLFPAEILKRQEYSYGEIFVRIAVGSRLQEGRGFTRARESHSLDRTNLKG